MVYDYLITLRKADNKFADSVTYILYLFALLYFVYFIFTSPVNKVFFTIISVAIVLAFIWIMIKRKQNDEASFSIGLLLAAVGWLLGGVHANYYMGGLYIIAAIVEKQVKFPREIGFSKDKISFNTFPKKILLWNDVNNVMIKDGLLTIDKKNNQLLQKEIDGEVTEDIETEFNKFCNSCIASVHSN